MSFEKSKRTSSIFTWSILLAVSFGLAAIITWARMPLPSAFAGDSFVQDATADSSSPVYYQIQKGTPAYLRNIHHSSAGCNWLGVAGQIFSAKAMPVSGLTVQLGGTFEGEAQSQSVRSGTAAQYGPGGFEIVIADKPADSQASLWLQIVDDDGAVRSEKILFGTSADCDRNLIIVNFVETDQNPLTSPTPGQAASATQKPTQVKTATSTPVFTRTKRPTPTVTPSATRFIPAYVRQPGSPIYKSNFANPGMGCNWMGVAGQVLDVNKKPIEGLIVQVDGKLYGKIISGNARTGSAPVYGKGGYEIYLAANPSSTTGSLYVTLSDEEGSLLSRKEYFSTYADCRRNLILFTFIQNPAVPTFTPVPSETPQASPTTLQPTISATATRLPPATASAIAPVTSTPLPYFEVQQGSPLYVRNLFHPEKGCHWLGIGGQVLGMDGRPLGGILLEAGGSLAGKDVFALGLSGASPRYGASGYELTLAEEATDSLDTVWILARDLQGRRLSDHIYLDTYSDCQKNLAYIILIQTR
jgi:hypothetical protein